VFAILPGFLTALSLIMAIGAQNAFVIRQGLTRKHVLLVVLVCVASDTLLISLGIGGFGAVISSLPWLLEVIRWGGVAYLIWFGVRSLISAFRNETLDTAGAGVQSAKKVLFTILGFTFLNPHVYLDTVILLGGIGSQFGDSKWFFAVGASMGSLVWFFSLGFGAKAASRFMSKPIFWRVLDSVIAVVMFAVALTLAFYRFS
jgi:L-lysine exporter family protein LysE/ArgO